MFFLGKFIEPVLYPYCKSTDQFKDVEHINCSGNVLHL